MMISPEELAEAFALNLRILKMQADGLTHQETLLQPPARGNCLNWVLGHLAANRDRVLRLLGETPELGEPEAERYSTGSEPILENGEGALHLTRLFEVLEAGQAAIDAALRSTPAEELEAEVQVGERRMRVRQRLFGLYFHDTYHTGQAELLRQLSGKDDQVI
jgi:uncharacterized damage-inducible protein DinB